jgi:hypothetical protein
MRIPFLIAAMLGVLSCTNLDRVPKGIIGKDSMENILWDMMQADQFSEQFLAKKSEKSIVKAQTIQLYEEIFQIHHVTKDDFEKSYDFYMGHPDITRTMLDSLSARASRERNQSYRAPQKFNPAKGHPLNAR